MSSVDLLLDFLDNRGYESVELLVGSTLAASHEIKEALAKRDTPFVLRVAEEIEADRLRLYTATKMIHTKLYLLYGDATVRAIITSANLSETALRANSQTNYALCIDAPGNSPIIQQIERDFETHYVNAMPFTGDLLALFEQRPDISREEVAMIWLGTASEGDSEAVQARAILQGMTAEAFAHPGEEERAVISLALPAVPAARRNVQRFLGTLATEDAGGEAKVSPLQLVRYVEEHHGVPLMRIDANKQELWLGFKGDIRKLNQPLPPPNEVNSALAGIEEYVGTVDLGECPDYEFAKASMWEALLYILSAPFADEQMRERRRHYGSVNRRGPRFLYLYGPSHNGKTTFLRYTLKLITGELVDPFNAGWFTKAHVRGAQAVGTCYPLLFDDLSSPTLKTFEDITKAHWESHWTNEAVFPQLVFTSNVMSLRDWAKSRVKRVDFDVHYVQSTENQSRLARILERPNPIFGWFSEICLRHIRDGEWLEDDELAVGRDAMRELYAYSDRKLPPHFPATPLEGLYDPDLIVWNDLLRRRKVQVQYESREAVVTFTDDLENPEVLEYLSALPQTVKYVRRGKTIVVQNPRALKVWLDSGAKSPWWRRLLGK